MGKSWGVSPINDELVELAENLQEKNWKNSYCIETQRRICSEHLTGEVSRIFEASGQNDSEFAVMKSCKRLAELK